MAKAKVDGIMTVQQSIEKFVKQGNEAAAQETEAAARLVLEEAQKNINNDTGALASSGIVATAARNAGIGTKIGSTVRFGGKPSKSGTMSSFGDGTRRNLNSLGQVEYAAAYHELKNPFLLKAIRTAEDQILQEFQRRYKILARQGKAAAPKPTTPGVSQSRDE